MAKQEKLLDTRHSAKGSVRGVSHTGFSRLFATGLPGNRKCAMKMAFSLVSYARPTTVRIRNAGRVLI